MHPQNAYGRSEYHYSPPFPPHPALHIASSSTVLPYLGITFENVKATIKPGSSKDYYTVKIDVVTNHLDGWALEIEELPNGVEVSTNKWSTDNKTEREKTVSVWVYIKASSARIGDIRTLSIYSGNIRKKIEIKIEAACESSAEWVGIFSFISTLLLHI